jgi:hypothetical protein
VASGGHFIGEDEPPSRNEGMEMSPFALSETHKIIGGPPIIKPEVNKLRTSLYYHILRNLQISANYRYVYSITRFRGVQILGGCWRYLCF